VTLQAARAKAVALEAQLEQLRLGRVESLHLVDSLIAARASRDTPHDPVLSIAVAREALCILRDTDLLLDSEPVRDGAIQNGRELVAMIDLALGAVSA
jgi:hypothetical protein